MIKDLLGGAAVGVGVLGYVPYTVGVLRGSVRPHAFTWFVWGLLTAIAFFAQVEAGGGPGAWVTGVTALFSFYFSACGWFGGKRDITRSDWVIFIVCLFSIPVWLITDNPLWAVIIITVVDALAFAPTFRKSFFRPYEELAFTYGASGIKFVFGICALDSLNLTTVLYPASLVLMNGLFVTLLFYRRWALRNA